MLSIYMMSLYIIVTYMNLSLLMYHIYNDDGDGHAWLARDVCVPHHWPGIHCPVHGENGAPAIMPGLYKNTKMENNASFSTPCPALD